MRVSFTAQEKRYEQNLEDQEAQLELDELDDEARQRRAEKKAMQIDAMWDAWKEGRGR